MPCGNVSDCFPCNNTPTTNTSAEEQDCIQEFWTAYGNLQNNTPPLGSSFRSNGCVVLNLPGGGGGRGVSIFTNGCQGVSEEESDTQVDAFLNASSQQISCVQFNWVHQPQDPPPCLNPPCPGGGSPPSPPTEEYPVFHNDAQACTAFCADGVPFTFTQKAGSFAASSQILADRMAASFACRQAVANRTCLNLDTTLICEGESSTLNFSCSGATLSPDNNLWQITAGSLPPGFDFTSGRAGPHLAVTGTATAIGDYTFTMRVTAPNGNFSEKPFTLTVIGITTPDPLPDAPINHPYSQALTVSGITGDATWNIFEGALPAGLTLDLLTGVISGTPFVSLAFQVEPYVFTVHVSNRDRTCTKQFHITLSGYYGPVTPDIFTNTPVSFGNIPNGNYTAFYVRGALKYTAGGGWAVNDTAPVAGDCYLFRYASGVFTQLTGFFAGGQFATQALCEAANEGVGAPFFHNATFPPAPVTVFLQDNTNPYLFHVPGDPIPSFILVPY